jgi:DNA-directed RNA polymerase specialized sigma24 family protein
MLDPALRAFVEAGDDVEVDRRLEALIEEQAAPLVRRIVARKLAGGGPATSPDDLEDIVSDALLALVSRLQSLRQDPESEAIESLDDYTAVVAYNAFAHYLRGRDPARSRLKNRLRYVLTRGSRFGLWDTPDGLACGLARWRPAPASPAAAENLERLVSDPERWRRTTWPRPWTPYCPLSAVRSSSIGWWPPSPRCLRPRPPPRPTRRRSRTRPPSRWTPPSTSDASRPGCGARSATCCRGRGRRCC